MAITQAVKHIGLDKFCPCMEIAALCLKKSKADLTATRAWIFDLHCLGLGFEKIAKAQSQILNESLSESRILPFYKHSFC